MIYIMCFALGVITLMINAINRSKEIAAPARALYEQLAAQPIRVVVASTESKVEITPQNRSTKKGKQILHLNDPMDRGTIRIEGDTLRVEGAVELEARLPHLEHFVVDGREQTIPTYGNKAIVVDPDEEGELHVGIKEN